MRAVSCLASGETWKFLLSVSMLGAMLAALLSIIPLGLHNSLAKCVFLLRITDEDAEVQRNEITCAQSHRWEVAEPEFQFGSAGYTSLAVPAIQCGFPQSRCIADSSAFCRDTEDPLITVW